MELPERLFAAGEEPKGVRVNAYHKSCRIKDIIGTLEEDEIQTLRNSTFGKLVSLSEKPSLSGRFGHFLLTRQLKVSKKHEAWFLFSGKPIRFSLREFVIVTGLPCGKIPPKEKKKKKKSKETPYWWTLFGDIESIRVDRVIRMLRKKTVTDPEIRVKMACLAILSSVLFPTSHFPKIAKAHAEQIRDIDVFFAYPWGRIAFNMTLANIKSRDILSLSQSSVAVKGLFLAIQLVVVEAVLKLAEEEPVECSSSEEESEDEGEQRKRLRYW